MHKLVIALKHGHTVHIKSDDPYGLAERLIRNLPDDRSKHFVGADGSDIYFRPNDVIAVEIPVHS